MNYEIKMVVSVDDVDHVIVELEGNVPGHGTIDDKAKLREIMAAYLVRARDVVKPSQRLLLEKLVTALTLLTERYGWIGGPDEVA